MMRTPAQEDGDEHRRVILDGLPAGSSVAGLSILCHDEAGRPAGACKGRLTMSWVKGVKKVALKEGVPVDLPALPVRAWQTCKGNIAKWNPVSQLAGTT